MASLAFGRLDLSFFLELIKGSSPIDFHLIIEGVYVAAFLAVIILAFFFILGLLSKSLFNLQVINQKIKAKEKEYGQAVKEAEAALKKLHDLKNEISDEEKKRLSKELEKADSGGETMHSEKSKLQYWRMVEGGFKKK